jgi:predicted DNA-binding ribbon-helix-helix protein
MLGKSSFDFIRSTDPDKGKDKEETRKINKKVVSYYLEEDTIDQIKHIAAEKNTSCSGLVSELLKHTLEQDENTED